MQAHVICGINSYGDNAVANRAEWVVNGGVVSSVDFSPGSYSQLEIDVPENANVRLDMAAINSDGVMAWTSSAEINVGSAPTPDPNPMPAPPPSPPSLGTPSVAYWF